MRKYKEHGASYIPLDYIKASISGVTPEQIKSVTNLFFTPVLKHGDVIQYEFAEHDKMKLKIFPSGYIELSGSLHKFYNDGGHNADQYTFKAFLETLNKLYRYFGIYPKNINIIGLEYGYNISPPVNTSMVLGGLQEHKGKSFSHIEDKHGNYYQAKHDEFWLKIYDKGKQFDLTDNCLRIEIKDMRFCRWRDKAKIFTLHDFILWDKKPLLDNIIKKWNEITFYDYTTSTDEYENYSNPNFWKIAREKLSRAGVKHHRDNLRRWNKRYGMDLQNKIENIILLTARRLQS